MNKIKAILGNNVRNLTKARNIKNKTRLATLTNTAPRTIYEIFRDNGNPKLETMNIIAEKLKVPTWFLLQDYFGVDTDMKLLDKTLRSLSSLKQTDLYKINDEIDKIEKYNLIKEELASYNPEHHLLKNDK